MEEIDVGIEKWADLSQAKKNFGARLDEAKTTHPELMNYKVVAHIINFLFYAKNQKNDEPGEHRQIPDECSPSFFGLYVAYGN